MLSDRLKQSAQELGGLLGIVENLKSGDAEKEEELKRILAQVVIKYYPKTAPDEFVKDSRAECIKAGTALAKELEREVYSLATPEISGIVSEAVDRIKKENEKEMPSLLISLETPGQGEEGEAHKDYLVESAELTPVKEKDGKYVRAYDVKKYLAGFKEGEYKNYITSRGEERNKQSIDNYVNYQAQKFISKFAKDNKFDYTKVVRYMTESYKASKEDKQKPLAINWVLLAVTPKQKAKKENSEEELAEAA